MIIKLLFAPSKSVLNKIFKYVLSKKIKLIPTVNKETFLDLKMLFDMV